MIALDESALECDLAETYHIYDYRALTPDRVALFSIGLRDSSRIKMKISGANYPLETLLQARILDVLNLLWWSKTKDAERNANRPESIYAKLAQIEKEKDYETFTSVEEFEQAMAEINRKGGTNGNANSRGIRPD